MKMYSRFLVPACFLSSLALANDPVSGDASYHPKSGDSLSKTVEIENELTLDDMSMEVNGQDMSEQAGNVEVAMKTTFRLAVTDRYETVADGRPTKLKRSFDEVSSTTHVSGSTPMTGENEKDIPMSSELEGTAVVFSWDGDGGYRTAFDGDQKGDEALLENLAEDLDLRGFLPTGEVKEGDNWEVPPEAVKNALAPGGDLKLRPDEGGNAMEPGQFSPNDMIGDIDGDFQATYAGTREEDGTRVAVIHLKLDAKSARDLTSHMHELGDKMKDNLPEGAEMDISSFDGEYEFEAEGELYWNVETGLAHSLHLSGQVRLIVDIAMTLNMGESEIAMDLSQTFTGSQTLTLSTGE